MPVYVVFVVARVSLLRCCILTLFSGTAVPAGDGAGCVRLQCRCASGSLAVPGGLARWMHSGGGVS